MITNLSLKNKLINILTKQILKFKKQMLNFSKLKNLLNNLKKMKNQINLQFKLKGKKNATK